MTFKLLTIFPEMLKAMLSSSILGRAIESGAIKVEVIDIRPFSLQKHKNTDDAPFGGGAGMVMTPEPTARALRYAMGDNFSGKRIYLSPKGAQFSQKTAERLSQEDELILLAGHYEGLDQRVIDAYIDEEISVGDYVLTGGELGQLIITDAVSRLLPGVLGNENSFVDESFSSGLLEYPQYTRPREFEGREVPEVLLNGDQKLIDRWRRDEAVKITFERRPEMLKSAGLDKFDRALLRRLREESAMTLNLVCPDEDKARRVKSRLREAGEGEIKFAPSKYALILDMRETAGEYIASYNNKEEIKIERAFTDYLPSGDEIARAREAGAELCGFSPLAFDPAFRRHIGDEGIKQALFFGLSREEFGCLAATLLPVKRVDEKAVHYVKGARALMLSGKFPACRLEFFDKSALEIELSAESTAFFGAALKFLESGEAFVAEEIQVLARNIRDILPCS